MPKLTNRERVARGLDLLREGVGLFVEREFQGKWGERWVEEVSQKYGRELKVRDGKIQWDTYVLLRIMISAWHDTFQPTLGHFGRSYVSELLEHRNRHAHDVTFSSDDTLRALDSIGRLLQMVSAPDQVGEVEKLKTDLARTVFDERARQKVRHAVAVEGTPKAGLQPWRDVITPHQDVASGRYMQAEFAADLAQVARGEGTDEYRDPVEFYRRTYVTEGLKDLLTGAVLRLDGSGGDPVVELQTNFGGGKTHSMLALYHLFSDTSSTTLPGIEPILKSAEIVQAPTARRAVLVGTALSPGKVSKKKDGTNIHTIWGEMAWQLGGRDGYQMVADSDKRGVSPGSKDLADLFTALSPCLVLIDEWVAYARQLVEKKDLPCGTFEAQASFAQALTEAARAAKKTLVVASVPSSKIEIGGDRGEYALEALRNVFERLGTPWRPATADEGFEIVRRRLFEPITDKDAFAARDAVIKAYAQMYRGDRTGFPAGCSEASYRHKLEAAYPIHPELFDRLYGEWSTLDKFQRTRGVLRLLAKVIHRLWEDGDTGLLIMPASIPMSDPAVKSELTRYLTDVWETIISEEVDGENALPLEVDSTVPNLGRYSACRRVTRTLYIGTAPGSEGKNPGIDDREVRLGCSQPGESVATFGDALRRLGERAKHIHQEGSRYWISTRANLNRMAEEKADDLLEQPEELEAEIVNRIKAEYRGIKARGNRDLFSAVHVCPDSSAEIEDDPEVRLAILHPRHVLKKGRDDCEALVEAKRMLEFKGSSQRLNRNCLVFLAPDAKRLEDLKQAAASYLAWRSILEQKETHDLTVAQIRQAETKLEDADQTVASRIRETWVHAIVPVQVTPTNEIEFDTIPVSGTDPLAKRTAAKLKQDGQLIPAMGGEYLRTSLDSYLWADKDHVSLGDLAEWFPRYLYLPRLLKRDVLEGAVQEGVSGLFVDKTFALSSGFEASTGCYSDLRMGGSSRSLSLHDTTLLVKPDVAMRQQEAEKKEKENTDENPRDSSDPPPPPPVTPPTPLSGQYTPTLFFGSVALDVTRVGRDAGRIAEEVVQHLSTLPGAEVEVTLEIRVKVQEGIEDAVVRTVRENCSVLKFGTHGFEKE